MDDKKKKKKKSGDTEVDKKSKTKKSKSISQKSSTSPNDHSLAFEALNKADYDRLLREFPQLIRDEQKRAEILHADKNRLEPSDVITGSSLTHYDETAGVAIPHVAVNSHRAMGNTVVPLHESYHIRYDRLRALVTGRLLPRRETLTQLRRQLQHTSAEVEATRKAIERETIADTDQILERLRTAESMRQSAIKHQIIQLEEELQAIERLVSRVDISNSDDMALAGTGGISLTSAAPGAPPVHAIRAPRAFMMVELIQQFSDLTAQIERLSSKPLSIQVDFPIDDFPKETAERLEIISRCDRYSHALSVKDHMLWAALQEKDKTLEQLDEERKLSHDYAKEVAQWAELSQTLKSKLDDMTKLKDSLEAQNSDLQSILREHNIFYVIKK